LGLSFEETWKKYQDSDHCITTKNFDAKEALIAKLTSEGKKEINSLKKSDPKYKSLDNSVLYAIYASRLAMQQAALKPITNNF